LQDSASFLELPSSSRYSLLLQLVVWWRSIVLPKRDLKYAPTLDGIAFLARTAQVFNGSNCTN
jgi:hypothetical protein